MSLQNHLKNIYNEILMLTVIILVPLEVFSQSPQKFSTEQARFKVKFKDEVSPYRVIGVFVLPGEHLKIQTLDDKRKKQYKALASGGKLTKNNYWEWTAPDEPGLYPLRIINTQLPDSITLNIFVMFPYSQIKGEYMNGYRIGNYPTIPLKQLRIYKLPKGFIEVTPENENTLVSPHFKLKHFLSKQQCGYPKYVVLKERLLLKLELILEKANEKGYLCETLHIMSGYRTPYYNKAIGNVKYSRHVWGGAADIFIDENPKDCMMDDLNKDGKINHQDAAILYDIIDDMFGKPWYNIFIGGLGRYKKTTYYGPFVHVDVRGFRARWDY